MAVKTTVLTASGTNQVYPFAGRSLTVYNDGNDDVQVDFDKEVGSTSFKIPVGVTHTFNYPMVFKELNYKVIAGGGGSASLYIIHVEM